ncbi:MAG: AAA family ATPase [Acidimicrobiales bacterium]|nr:AAA family ATPase [Acidimicrobiales bacterium]
MRFDWWRGRDDIYPPLDDSGPSRHDPSLALAVDEFRRAVAPVLAPIAAGVPAGRPEHADGDVIQEAFNLSCAFIDADGLATDAELLALLGTFSPLLDHRFAATTPATARSIGLTEGKRWILEQPSALFEILLGADRRDGTDHASVYLSQAVAIGHMVATLDDLTTRTELDAIERFRATHLDRIRRDAPPSATGAATPPSDRSARSSDGAGAPDAASASTADDAEATSTGVAVPELPPPRPLEELLAELDGLIGLADAKREVHLVADLLQVQRLRRERGLATVERSHHLVFTGNPGTGKTTVGRLIAAIYRTLGVVERGQLVETDRSGLVAGYVGQTATKVVAVFDEADGGVLLIDEAYSLVRGSDSDFGREAIDTIVKLVEDRRDRIVVIMAGYPDEMAELVGANPGLRSRFPTTIHFPDYTDDELTAIFSSLAERGHYLLDATTRATVQAWFAAQTRTQGFGNGRLARNLFEAAVGRQAGRVVDITDPTDLELVTLLPQDIPATDDPNLTS